MRKVKPPVSIIEKLLILTIKNKNSNLIDNIYIKKHTYNNDIEIYRVTVILNQKIDFNELETHKTLLFIYYEIYARLENYFQIDKKQIKIQLIHWLYIINKLNSSILLRTSKIVNDIYGI